jgi:DNA-binding transcriptional ArsR family regulator
VNSEITEPLVRSRSPLNVSRPRPYTIDVAWGTGSELLIGLGAYVEAAKPEKLPSYSAGAEWLERTRARLSSETHEAIDRAGGKACFAELLPLVFEAPEPHGAAAFVETLKATSPVRLRRILLGGHSPNHCTADVPLTVLTAAADGDPGAERAMLDAADEWHRDFLQHLFSIGAAEFKELVVRSTEGWYHGVLRPDERALARTLRASARATRALARRLEPGALITQVTNGIVYSGEPGIGRVLLVPQITARPWAIFAEHDDTKIVCYAVSEEEVTGGAPPEPLVAAYKALGDETRLRILRRLADGPATLHELTDLLGLAKSTVHGHMLVLRTGGLVTADISEKAKGYALRTDGIAESAALLEGFLTPDTPTATEGIGT